MRRAPELKHEHAEMIHEACCRYRGNLAIALLLPSSIYPSKLLRNWLAGSLVCAIYEAQITRPHQEKAALVKACVWEKKQAAQFREHLCERKGHFAHLLAPEQFNCIKLCFASLD